MNKYIKTLSISLLVLAILPLFTHGQIPANTKQKKLISKKIDSVISRNFKSEFLKDSIALYAYNFSVEIAKQKGGKTSVTRISANDTLAYKLFPTYKRLYSINYSPLMGTRKKITLVIPVLVANFSATAEKKYKRENGNSLVDMKAAINVAYALYSTMSYDNSKDAETSLGTRLYRSKSYETEEIINTDKVFLPASLIQILNIK